MEELKPCPLSSERAIEILWGEVAQDQQPLHCTRKELCDSVEMAEESIRHSYPKSDNAELYQKAYQELLQKSMHLNQELIKKLKAAPKNEPLEMSPKHKAALTELVEMMNEDENKPLTVEELRKMQKQYVWIVDSDPDMTFSGWAVCDGKAVYYLYFNKDCPIGSASIDLDDGYGKTWIAYRHKPEGSEKA